MPIFLLFMILVGCVDKSGDLGKYESLNIGMARDDVLTLFSSSPRFPIKYKEFEILYISTTSVRSPEGINLDSPKSVSSLSDLPDTYGYIQIAFDQKARLIAYSWIGESYYVFFTGGKVKGSSLSDLPDLIQL